MFSACRRRGALALARSRNFSGELSPGLDLGQLLESHETGETHGEHFDLAVLGGGSGGLAAANKAAELGASVALFDAVVPSPRGSVWGLGGTCVNVGCIPKKLMHYAALFGEQLRHDAPALGWSGAAPDHEWGALVRTVQDHVRSLNFSYRAGLNESVAYFNGLGTLTSSEAGAPLGVAFAPVPGSESSSRGSITASHVLLAPGGRPHVPDDVPGARELAFTSDDVFSLPHTPGRTLVVGGSYVALECASFLCGLGYPTTLAVRSKVLRGVGFDEQCADKLVELLRAAGADVRLTTIPISLCERDGGGVDVELSDGSHEAFDTVLYATGRAVAQGIGLADAGVATLASDGRVRTVLGDALERAETEAANDVAAAAEAPVAAAAKLSELGLSGGEAFRSPTNDRVFAIGDAAHTGCPELTPVAIKQGELVAEELFGEGVAPQHRIDGDTVAGLGAIWDPLSVPSVVFTGPAEYGRVGLSEAAAVALFGEANVETYISEWQSLEVAAMHRKTAGDGDNDDLPNTCVAKLVCLLPSERIVGLHYVGPHAGEATQGLALAMRMGATKNDFDCGVMGIHPTDAEALLGLRVTRRSGENFVASGGCGGGRCG